MIEIVKPSIELVECTMLAERHIERCGREAYGSASSKSLEDCQAWIQKRIAQGEEDVVEHAVATWHIVCSRVVSHELVRHRLASYTQMSQRFTEKATKAVILPPGIAKEDEGTWVDCYIATQRNYEAMREKYPRQTARYLLSNGTATSLYATWNFRVMRHILKLRAAPQAQPEFRDLAMEMGRVCVQNWPGVFGDLTGLIDPDRLTEDNNKED